MSCATPVKKNLSFKCYLLKVYKHLVRIPKSRIGLINLRRFNKSLRFG